MIYCNRCPLEDVCTPKNKWVDEVKQDPFYHSHDFDIEDWDKDVCPLYRIILEA